MTISIKYKVLKWFFDPNREKGLLLGGSSDRAKAFHIARIASKADNSNGTKIMLGELMTLKICETFYSLMGESSRAGLPAWFIRLSGCNLRCSYCDTTYAYEEGEEVAVAGLLKAAEDFPAGLVLVTGGEPLLQEETPALLAGLAEAGFEVCLETNGSRPINQVDARVHRIVDLKCPGSGMSEEIYWPNLQWLTARDEVKFVVSDHRDFLWALRIIREFGLSGRLPLLISPVFGQAPAQEAAAWILESGLPLRLNLQLHKYLWGTEARGK
jgi:7-carboxy-7-deazaguanine synthase